MLASTKSRNLDEVMVLPFLPGSKLGTLVRAIFLGRRLMDLVLAAIMFGAILVMFSKEVLNS